MQQEQIKTLLVNILTGSVIVGVLFVGYIVFLKNKEPVISTVTTVAKIAEETALIGNEIDSTVRDLGELSKSISNSVVILELPAFKNLRDFTAQIPYESIGRENPFVLTAWKEQTNALLGGGSNTPAASSEVISANAHSEATPAIVLDNLNLGI
jgi:hypothetical protein